MGIVLSQQFELQRQLDMIEWSENFLRLQRSVLPPADYLAAWYVSLFMGLNGSAAHIVVDLQGFRVGILPSSPASLCVRI